MRRKNRPGSEGFGAWAAIKRLGVSCVRFALDAALFHSPHSQLDRRSVVRLSQNSRGTGHRAAIRMICLYRVGGFLQ